MLLYICKRKSQLVEHISINHSELKAAHKDFFFQAGGDKNNFDIKHILDISPNLHMHNTGPKHGTQNINVLVSDMVHLYSDPLLTPNVPTDIPDGGGKVSDHPIVYSKPRLEGWKKSATEVVIQRARRLNEARKAQLAKWIQHESWEALYDSTNRADKFIEVVFEKLDAICPEEEI